MKKNLNCAAMGYDCAFSVTADAGQEDFMVDTVQSHASQFHPELIDNEGLKPAIKAKLMDLLNQAKYSDSSSQVQ